MRLVAAIAVFLLAIVSAAPAMARRPDKIVTVPNIEYHLPWLAMLYAAVFIAGICVVGFKRSGRTHLD